MYKINVLFVLCLFLGINQINCMQKPKLALIDRIDKLEKEVGELNQYRECLARVCSDSN